MPQFSKMADTGNIEVAEFSSSTLDALQCKFWKFWPKRLKSVYFSDKSTRYLEGFLKSSEFFFWYVEFIFFFENFR